MVCLSIVALGSGQLDLRVQHRERYVFVPLVLTTLLAARGLSLLWGASAARGISKLVPLLLGLLLGVQLLALQLDWRGPLDRGGSSESKVWWVGATGEAHESAAHWISSRLQPLEEGLLLCGDYWSLYSILPFLDRGPFDEGRLAVDYIHEPNSLLVSELRRTAHRRRFLVDHASGIWEAQIRTALPQLGLDHRDADYEVRTPDGRPILRVWELPPRPPSR